MSNSQKIDEAEITDFIHNQKDSHPIQIMCDVLDVPRSTYYKSLDKTISNRDRENIKLTNIIIETGYNHHKKWKI